MIHVCTVCGSRNDHRIETSVADSGVEYTAAMCFSCGEVYIVERGPLGEIYREPTLQELAQVTENYGPVLRVMRQFRAENPPHPHG